MPTVFITSRSRSSSVMSSSARCGSRAMSWRLNSSISTAAIFLNAGSSASPDSSSFESMSSVLGRSSQRFCDASAPWTTLLNSGRLPGTMTVPPPGQRSIVAGDPVADELADAGVLADDDEHRRRAGAGVLPGLVRAVVVGVELVERRFELGGELRVAAEVLVGAALTGELVADLRPELAEHRAIGRHRVVGHRHPAGS